MKNMTKHFGIIAVAAVVVFSMAACASTSGGSSDQAAGKAAAASNAPKTLIVTGVDKFSGIVLSAIATDGNDLDDSIEAVGMAVISNNSVTIPLVLASNEEERWTGTGEYFILLIFEQDGSNIIYYYAQGSVALKYNFTEAATSIAFSQFREFDRNNN